MAKILPQLFSLLYRTKPAKAMTDFQSAFYRDVQLLPGGWIFFVANLFCCFQNVKAISHNSKCRYGERGAAAGDRGVVHAHPVKSETGHRIAAGTCNPGGKQV